MDAVIEKIKRNFLESIFFEEGEPRMIDYITGLALVLGCAVSVVTFIEIVLVWGKFMGLIYVNRKYKRVTESEYLKVHSFLACLDEAVILPLSDRFMKNELYTVHGAKLIYIRTDGSTDKYFVLTELLK